MNRAVRTSRAALVAILMAFGLVAFGAAALAQDSMIVKESPHSVDETLDRLAKAAEAKGLKVFSRIDHAGGAKSAGMELRPTQLLVIGNPEVGTPLMQADPRMALELPLRIASWQDAKRTVWIGYWSPEVFAVQYGVEGQDERLKNIAAALDALTAAAVATD